MVPVDQEFSRSCWHTRLRSRCHPGPQSCQGSIRTGFNSKLSWWLSSAFHSSVVVALKAEVPCCGLIDGHLQLLATWASSQGSSRHESLFPSNHIVRRVRQSVSKIRIFSKSTSELSYHHLCCILLIWSKSLFLAHPPEERLSSLKGQQEGILRGHFTGRS